jgi:protein O-mannosyl-transferase
MDVAKNSPPQFLRSTHWQRMWSSPRNWLLAAVIFIVVAIAYWPARSGGFVLDDDLLLTHNATITAPDGLARFWWPWNLPIVDQPIDYWPVSNSTLWLEWRLWGMNPTGYHVTNMLLHTADCLLIWLVLSQLAIPGAWLAALLFAVHPVNVESVAWIAQRKNVLALFFFLLSIVCWLRADKGRGARSEGRGRRDEGREAAGIMNSSWCGWYCLSFICFVLAMLSKGSVAILPAMLLLLVWWQRGRITRFDFVRALPFFAVAALLTWINICFQTQGNLGDQAALHTAADAIRNVNFLQRLLGAAGVVWFYLEKALVPLQLVFVYPQWDIQPAYFSWWLPLLASLTVTAMLVWKRNSPRRWIQTTLFAWLFFNLAILPAMGFVDVGYMRFSLVADHYQHIALIAVVAVVAAGIDYTVRRLSAAWVRRPVQLAYGAFIVVLLMLARQQSSLYAGPITLYTKTLEANPTSWLVHNNLGQALLEVDRKPEAMRQFDETVRLKPDSAIGHDNLGMRLSEVGQLSEAIKHFRAAIQLQPDSVDAYNNLAMALDTAGKPQEAIQQLHAALKIRPEYAEAHNNLGSILLKCGRLEEAVQEFQQALKLKTDYFEAHNNLAIIFAESGMLPEAIDHYQQALQLKPDSAETHNNLGNALTQSGKFDDAIEQYQQALRLKPDYVQAYVDLAMAQSASGRKPQAISAAESALQLARLQEQTLLAARIDAWLKIHRTAATR